MAAFLGAMIFLPENDAASLIEYLVITAMTLGFLFLISGRKTFGFLNHQTGCTVRALISGLAFGYVHVAFAEEEEEGAAPYTSGSVSTTILFLVQLVVTGLCFLAVFKKAGKTIDYKKILEEW